MYQFIKDINNQSYPFVKDGSLCTLHKPIVRDQPNLQAVVFLDDVDQRPLLVSPSLLVECKIDGSLTKDAESKKDRFNRLSAIELSNMTNADIMELLC